MPSWAFLTSLQYSSALFWWPWLFSTVIPHTTMLCCLSMSLPCNALQSLICLWFRGRNSPVRKFLIFCTLLQNRHNLPFCISAFPPPSPQVYSPKCPLKLGPTTFYTIWGHLVLLGLERSEILLPFICTIIELLGFAPDVINTQNIYYVVILRSASSLFPPQSQSLHIKPLL